MNHNDTHRYDRQIRLFGVAGQRALAQAHLGIVGLGGLGSHIAQQLAYLGIHRYTLIDGDRIDDHGLNRVVTARPDDIGANGRHELEQTVDSISCPQTPCSSFAPVSVHRQ